MAGNTIRRDKEIGGVSQGISCDGDDQGESSDLSSFLQNGHTIQAGCTILPQAPHNGTNGCLQNGQSLKSRLTVLLQWEQIVVNSSFSWTALKTSSSVVMPFRIF